VEGAEYELPKDEIVAWLAKFGNPVTELTEDKERDSSDSDNNEYFNGIYSIKMDLRVRPPQFLPISGKKIKIYYNGIEKRCVKCFGTGHLKKDCVSAPKDWMEYVSDLMFQTGFNLNMLGDAKKYLEKWRLENKEKTEARNEQKAQEEAQQSARREALRGKVLNISDILHNQSIASGPRPSIKTGKECPVPETSTQMGKTVEEEESAWLSLRSMVGEDLPTKTGEDEVKKKDCTSGKPRKMRWRHRTANFKGIQG
jgi:hypothetical protein